MMFPNGKRYNNAQEFLDALLKEKEELLKAVECPSCKEYTERCDMTTFNGKDMCEGCAETADMFESDDPCGKDWRS